MKKVFLALLIAPFIAAVFVSIHVLVLFKTPYEGTVTKFHISPGEGFGSINYRLTKKGLVSNARLFHYYTKLKNDLENLKQEHLKCLLVPI